MKSTPRNYYGDSRFFPEPDTAWQMVRSESSVAEEDINRSIFEESAKCGLDLESSSLLEDVAGIIKRRKVQLAKRVCQSVNVLLGRIHYYNQQGFVYNYARLQILYSRWETVMLQLYNFLPE